MNDVLSQMTQHKDVFLALMMGIGLAASCGFRIFVPPLLLGIGLRLGWVPTAWVSSSFGSLLASPAVLLALSSATLFEVLASKIPGIDHILDGLGAPLAVIAGTLLSSNMLIDIQDPILKYGLGFIAGGGSAGLIHAGNSALRVLSTKTTGGLGNPFFSMIESTLATVLSLVSIFLPLLMIALLCAVIAVMLWAFKSVFKKKRPQQ